MKRSARLVSHFGSRRAAVATFVLLGGVALLRPTLAWLAPALGALALALLATLVANPRLRRQPALFVAHLAALVFLVLVGVGRLATLEGRFELTEGVPFDGRLIDGAAGPWHANRLHRLGFRHEGFEIEYAPGRQRGPTRNTVAWTGDDGRAQRATIGDHVPLQLHGYRITTTPNKGFAPVLHWQPAQGETLVGAVHLPSYPMHELRQHNEWRLPDGRALWLQLVIDETLIPLQAAGAFRRPQAERLVVRLGDERVELEPGAEVALGGGRLRYEGLATWMGYRIHGDPTLPWLLASALLAALAMLAHAATAGRTARAAARGPARALETVDG